MQKFCIFHENEWRGKTQKHSKLLQKFYISQKKNLQHFCTFLQHFCITYLVKISHFFMKQIEAKFWKKSKIFAKYAIFLRNDFPFGWKLGQLFWRLLDTNRQTSKLNMIVHTKFSLPHMGFKLHNISNFATSRTTTFFRKYSCIRDVNVLIFLDFRYDSVRQKY